MHAAVTKDGESLSPHELHEGNQLMPLEDIDQTFLVPRQSSEPANPDEIPLYHPPARQEGEAALDLGQLRDCEHSPVIGCGTTRLALLDRGRGYCLTRRRLDHRSRCDNLVPILGIGWRHTKRRQIFQRMNGEVGLASTQPIRPPLSGVLCRVRLSRMRTVGCGAFSRITT